MLLEPIRFMPPATLLQTTLRAPAAVPPAVVPTKLPCTTFPVEEVTEMPLLRLPETRFPAPAAVPPTTLLLDPLMKIPMSLLNGLVAEVVPGLPPAALVPT